MLRALVAGWPPRLDQLALTSLVRASGARDRWVNASCRGLIVNGKTSGGIMLGVGLGLLPNYIFDLFLESSQSGIVMSKLD